MIERTGWIVNSIVIGEAIPAILAVTGRYVWLLSLRGYQDDRTIRGDEVVMVITVIWVLGMGFLAARGFILVERFRSLAFLRPVPILPLGRPIYHISTEISKPARKWKDLA